MALWTNSSICTASVEKCVGLFFAGFCDRCCVQNIPTHCFNMLGLCQDRVRQQGKVCLHIMLFGGCDGMAVSANGRGHIRRSRASSQADRQLEHSLMYPATEAEADTD